MPAIFCSTAECASAEKPRPPYSFGMIDGTVEERLLFHAELRLGQLQQLRPVRLAAEQLAFETDCAGLECDLFGIRELRRDLLERGEQRRAEAAAAEIDQIQRQCDDAENDQRDRRGEPGRSGQPGGAEDGDDDRDGPGAQTGAQVGRSQRNDYGGEER
jgi:hypothetical protein